MRRLLKDRPAILQLISGRSLTIPEELYERARLLAQAQQRDVEGVIAGLLDEALPLPGKEETLSASDPAVEREMQAYIGMHPELKAKYLGQHVAIHGGELEQLFVYIYTSLPVEEALSRLDALDDEWYLDMGEDTKWRFNFNLRFGRV